MILNVMLVTVLTVGAGSNAVIPQQPPAQGGAAAAVKIPETPAGRALNEFVTSLNAGGDKRRSWLKDRTTLEQEQLEQILKQDTEILEQHGAVTVVRLPETSATKIAAVLRHAKSGAHGHLTIEVQPDAPHKVVDMQLRGATPEEIKR